MRFQTGEFVIETGYPHILYRVDWSFSDQTCVRPIDDGPAEVISTNLLESFSIPAAMV